MGIQNDFVMGDASNVENRITSSTADTASYITDLLSELQMIANVSGLAHLSDDIRAVISKNLSRSTA